MRVLEGLLYDLIALIIVPVVVIIIGLIILLIGSITPILIPIDFVYFLITNKHFIDFKVEKGK